MRIKRGTRRQKRHKKILKLAKGYRMSYGTLFKRSREAVLHAGQYSMAHRRRRRSQMKRQWNKAINAGLYDTGVSYSNFKHLLKQNEINLNNKMLAELAVNYPQHFEQLVATVQK